MKIVTVITGEGGDPVFRGAIFIVGNGENPPLWIYNDGGGAENDDPIAVFNCGRWCSVSIEDVDEPALTEDDYASADAAQETS